MMQMCEEIWLFSAWWREGLRLVLDLIKIVKTIKPRGEILVHCVVSF